MTKTLFLVDNFSCSLGNASKPIQVSRNICLSLESGQVLAIVGESGSGKSVSFSRMFGLGDVVQRSGAIHLANTRLDTLDAKALAEFRGKYIGLIFQDPALAFNPTMTLGKQLCEAVLAHGILTQAKAKAKAIQLLSECDLDTPEAIMGQYPHQLSGGMLQRVMLAMALMCDPVLLIADEPTTALDALSSQKVLALIRRLTQSRNMACVLITHDFDVVAQVATHVGVMYGGSLLEAGTVEDMMRRPQHPYTQALQQCRPERGKAAKLIKLRVINGQPPVLSALPSGCVFHPRCDAAMAICAQQSPPLARGYQCWLSQCGTEGGEPC